MSKLPPDRPGFRLWIDEQADPHWKFMPLTHVTKGIGAEDIVQSGAINPHGNEIRSYFFYGRPAYRVHGDGAIKVEAACPFCFILTGELIKSADEIFAFDSGAFANRMYKHVLMEEMQVADFSLQQDAVRPNKLIARVFKSPAAYFDGDLSQIPAPEEGSEAWQFHARAYLQLLLSPGRNEPDDRICSIEITMNKDVPLAENLKAIIVPHTLWGDGKKAPWLSTLSEANVTVRPYFFIPGRHPEHYHTLLECQVRDLYKEWGFLE
jgi:hypothetical protein